MKITAKEIKVGQTVKVGYVTLEVEKIVKGQLKNGKDIYTVYGTATKKHTGSRRFNTYKNYDLEFKSETKVNVI